MLGGNAWRLYEYVVRHYLGSISPNMKYSQQNVELEIGSDKFTLVGKKLISPGFASVMPWLLNDYAEEEDENLDGVVEFLKGDSFPIHSALLKKGETTPPDYLSESELIGLMEKFGIGTDASMATFIHLICERNYVKVCKP